jgi:hypothetical protein
VLLAGQLMAVNIAPTTARSVATVPSMSGVDAVSNIDHTG